MYARKRKTGTLYNLRVFEGKKTKGPNAKTKILLPQALVTLPNYWLSYLRPLVSLAPKNFSIIWVSNLYTFSMLDNNYSRNASCAFKQVLALIQSVWHIHCKITTTLTPFIKPRRTKNRQPRKHGNETEYRKKASPVNTGMPKEIAYYFKNISCQSLVKIEV